MFDEMTRAITERYCKTSYAHSGRRKVEREQVAKVTGTNKDRRPSVKGPCKTYR